MVVVWIRLSAPLTARIGAMLKKVNGLYKSEVSVHAGGLEHPLNAF